jgi:hypothetical protein
MEGRLEKILKDGKGFLAKAVIASVLLGGPAVIGCGKGNDDYESSYVDYNGDRGSSHDSKSEWKKCCSCLSSNDCISISYSSCVNRSNIEVNTTCLDNHCYSKCSRAGTIDYPDCIYCGEREEDKIILHDEWCPEQMHCVATTRGVICMPRGASEYKCEF